MIFSFIPPEINSTLMYAGPGSGPLAAAATGWQGLASDLQSAATSFQSIVTNLTSGAWTGPSSDTMLAAVEPYVAWLNTTSAQASQTAAQAAASVNAYEAAHAATVPPSVVFENRAQLIALIATNFFGQNTPAIAANEAAYSAMWATDSTAMNTYLAAATQTSMVPQMAAPAAATTGAAQVMQTAAAPAAASGGSLGSEFTALLQGLGGLFTGSTSLSSLSTEASTLSSSLMSTLGLSTLAGSGTTTAAGSILPLQAAYYSAMMASLPARMFMSMGSSMSRGASGAASLGGGTLLNSVASLVDGKMQAVIGSVAGQLKNWGASVSAQLGRASAMGGLSVPHAWTEATTGALTRAAPVLPNTSVAAPTPAAGLPGGPFGHALMGALSGRGMASMAAKAPKIVPKSPAAG